VSRQVIAPSLDVSATSLSDRACDQVGSIRQGALAARKVLIIVENLPVPFDRRVWQEALALHDAGAEVSVICPKAPGFDKSEETLEGIRIYRHNLPLQANAASGFLLEYAAALFHQMRLSWKIFFRHNFDTIHACNPPDLIFLVALPFKLIGKRFIFDHHDICPELYEAKFARRGAFLQLLLLFEWMTFKASDVVVSTNESYRRIAYTRGGKRAEDVFVVRSGPDLSRLRVLPPDPALKNGRRFLVGYVGIMGAQEGIDLLLETASHLIRGKRRSDIQFVLVGGGPQLEKYRTDCREMGLDEHVDFTGQVPDEVLFTVLSTADVCVNPDRVNQMNDQSTMNKIMEYMAFSKAIVQYDVTEGRYSAGSASLYARPNDPLDFADKIEALLADEAARRTMGAFGRKRVQEELAWKYQVPELIAAYGRAAR